MNISDADDAVTGAHSNNEPPKTARGEALRELLNAAPRLFNGKTRGQWRKIVVKISEFAAPAFHSEAASRRVQGAFGEMAASRGISKVAVIADLSTAATAPMLSSWLAELFTFSTTAEINMARFQFLCFFHKDAHDESDRYSFQSAKKSFPFLQAAFVRGDALAGATDLSTALELAKARLGTRADALVIFTTGLIGDAVSGAASGYLRSMRKKTIWVLPAGVRDMDDAFKNAAADAFSKRRIVSPDIDMYSNGSQVEVDDDDTV